MPREDRAIRCAAYFTAAIGIATAAALTSSPARAQYPAAYAATSTAQTSAVAPRQLAPQQAQQAAVRKPNLWIGGASVIPPRPMLTADPYPFSFLLGYPVMNLGMPQPIGHQQISTGPNSGIYRPVTDLGMLVRQATAALKTADYELVLVHLDPVLSAAPDDGNAWLLRAQALFALGSYDKAAGALHRALLLLPRAAWGVPGTKAREYFASAAEYHARLQALETYVAAHPDAASGHFLLGYYYGFGGRDAEATRELKITLRLKTASDQAADALLAPPTTPTGALVPGSVAPFDAEAPRPGLPLEKEAPLPVAPRAREF